MKISIGQPIFIDSQVVYTIDTKPASLMMLPEYMIGFTLSLMVDLI